MKYSIRKQMIGIFVGLIVCMIIGLFIINAFFLQPYYVENKKESFVKMYDDIGKVMDDGNIQNDSVRNTLAYTAERYNFSYMVYNFAERQGYRKTAAAADRSSSESAGKPDAGEDGLLSDHTIQ